MAFIETRTYKSGREVHRVIFNKKGFPRTVLTFDDYIVACKWLEIHEVEFHHDPEKIYQWREEMFLKNRREKYSGNKTEYRIKYRPVKALDKIND